MIASFSRRLLLLLVLFLLVSAAPAVTFEQLNIELPAWLAAHETNLLYIIICVGLLLCWFFYNSREFILLLILGVCAWGLQRYIWQGNLTTGQKDLLFDLITLLLPLNFLVINLMSERGLWNRYGLRRLVFVAVEIAVITWLANSPQKEIAAFLDQSYLAWRFLDNTVISQTALASMVISAVFILGYCALRPGHLQAGRLLALAAVIAALHFIENRELSLLYFNLGALVLILTTVIHAYHLAYRDELTRLPSRRALRQQLLALGKTYALAMVDVDHFKKLNDTYGHDVGDDVLKLLATLLRQVAGGGRAYRYGGEEFTIVFAGKTASEARIYLEALCNTIANTPFVIRHKKRPRKKPEKRARHAGSKQLKVTVSIGVAENTPAHGSYQDVIKAADNALYKAKKGGRNRVAISN